MGRRRRRRPMRKTRSQQPEARSRKPDSTVGTVLLQQYCCNSIVATLLLQQYCCHIIAATVMLPHYCCNSTVAILQLQLYCCNNLIATGLTKGWQRLGKSLARLARGLP